MTLKLFLLGLPGSGKSTVARYIVEYVRSSNWSTSHFGDYRFLQEMFLNDTESKQFNPADGGGFDVIDLTVFDTALQLLEQSIDESMSTSGSKEIILIEFSRNDYQHAFRQFSKEFLQSQNTYFIHLATDLDTCKQRISHRTANPTFEDDYPVSEYILEQYYHQDDGQYLPDTLFQEYQIDQQQVRIINNNKSLEDVSKEIDAFIEFIVARAPLDTDAADTLKGVTSLSRIREEPS